MAGQITSVHAMALRYVRNTAGGATRDNFVEDHEPIGEMLWAELSNAGLVTQNDEGRIVLTDEGTKAIA